MRKGKISISVKFFTLILLVVIIPFIVLTVVVSSSAYSALTESIKVQNESLVLSAANAAEDKVLGYRNTLKAIGGEMFFLEGVSNEGKREILLKAKYSYHHKYNIKLLVLLDEDGKEIVRTDLRQPEDDSKKPEFIEAKNKGYYLRWLELDPILRISTVLMSVPLFENEEFRGVLMGEIFLSDIWSTVFLASTSLPDNVYLLTENKEVAAEILSGEEGTLPNQLREIAKGISFEQRFFSKEMEVEEDFLTTGVILPSLGWKLVVFKPLSEIYEPAVNVRNKILFFAMGVLLAALIVALLFSRSVIVRPIKEFYKGIQKIKAGNLGHRLNIHTRDEIEELADEFNHMTTIVQSLNVDLRREVAVKTKELQEKLDILERFYKLTVGRELKMVELKKEIEDLREEMEEYEAGQKRRNSKP